MSLRGALLHCRSFSACSLLSPACRLLPPTVKNFFAIFDFCTTYRLRESSSYENTGDACVAPVGFCPSCHKNEMSRLGHIETIPSPAPDMACLRLPARRAWAVKIRAKQSQFPAVPGGIGTGVRRPWGLLPHPHDLRPVPGSIVRNKPNLQGTETDANCCFAQRLGGESTDTAPEKTKPIWTSPAGAGGPIVQNKANFGNAATGGVLAGRSRITPYGVTTNAGPIVRNKPNLQGAETDANCCSAQRLGEEFTDTAPEKTKPIWTSPAGAGGPIVQTKPIPPVDRGPGGRNVRNEANLRSPFAPNEANFRRSEYPRITVCYRSPIPIPCWQHQVGRVRRAVHYATGSYFVRTTPPGGRSRVGLPWR